MRKLLLLLLCIVVLTGCQGKPLPEGMEEETVLDAGREVVISLVRGEYDAVAEAFREDISVTEDQLRTLLETAAAKAGAYKEIDDAMATGRESDGEDFAVAVVLAKYEKRRVLFEVAFDPDMALIGLRIEKK